MTTPRGRLLGGSAGPGPGRASPRAPSPPQKKKQPDCDPAVMERVNEKLRAIGARHGKTNAQVPDQAKAKDGGVVGRNQ